MEHTFSRNRVLAIAFGVLLSACGAAARAEAMLHAQGLAFTPDGKGLMVTAHAGLAVYRDGRWNKVAGPGHTFKGLSMASNAIYTSGHPAPGALLLTPLGLIKSTDRGATWRQLGLAGESDFHLLAAGYRSNVIYVLATQPNSQMPQRGVHYTQDEGKSWKLTPAATSLRLITSIAAHPTHAGTIAVGTFDGLHVSRDFGTTFQRIGPAAPVSAVLFDSDGRHLHMARGNADALERMALDAPDSSRIALPPLEGDAVTHIAQNPIRSGELAIATRRRHVFLSTGANTGWKPLARDGQGL